MLDMQILKYLPERMYGFLLNSQKQEIFFHLRFFQPLAAKWEKNSYCSHCAIPCPWAESSPPPIVGESVSVEMDSSGLLRAQKVIRLTPPVPMQGRVETFDALRGYGFISGQDGITYHLHRCEVLEGRLPLLNQQVTFYAGSRQNKPRACHIKLCDGVPNGTR